MAHGITDGYKIAKEIENEWFLGTDHKFNIKADKYHQLRKYARGEHSVETSKSLIVKDGDKESFTNYDFSPIQILPKFKDKLVNDMLPQLYVVEANAVDQYSTDLKNEERNKLRKRMVSKGLDDDMKELFGIDMESMHEGDRPESEEEIDLRMSIDYKPNIEIAVEEALKYTFELNDWDETLFALLNDAVDIGRIATMATVEPSKGIVLDRIDPAELVWSFSRKRNHSDCWYYGLRKRITVSELQVMTSKVLDMGKNTAIEILTSNTDFIKEIRGSVDEVNRRANNEENRDPGSMDLNEKLDVLYYTYKTVNETHHKKKSYKTGATKITPFKGDFNGEETRGFEVITEKKEVWYEGYLILGTTYFFNHKLVDNLAYDKKTGINRVVPPINMYATSLYEGTAKGMIERCVTLVDKMQTVEIKIQQLVAAAKPSGIRIDVSKINNIEGAGGAVDYRTIMKIYNETGNEIYASGDGEENEFSQGNIHELNNGVVRGIMDLVAIQNNYLTQLRDAIGLPQGADASMPHPDTAVRVQEQVIRSSNVTVSHVLDSVLKLARYTSNHTFIRIKEVFKYYPHIKDSYIQAVGQVNADLVDSLKNLDLHDLGIFTSLKPNVQALSQLENNIALSLDRQTINLDDAQEVRDIGKDNTKLANQLLRIRREKSERKLADREDAKIKLQGEQQSNNTQVAGQMEQQKLQITLQIDQARIQSEAEGEIAVAQELSRLKKEELVLEYSLRDDLEKTKGEFNRGNMVFSEQEKTTRQDKNNADALVFESKKSKEKKS